MGRTREVDMGASANDQPNLYGVESRRGKKKTPPAPNKAVQNILGQYRQLYEARYSEMPHVTDKDGALLKRLIASFTEPVVAERLALYMRWDDQFVIDNGHSVGVFSASWPKLMALAKQRSAKSRVPDAAETLRRLRGGK